MTRAVVVAAFALLSAGIAHAQVAVSTAIAADDAAERDIAALVVREARAHWAMASPPFVANTDAQQCKAGDNECLRHAAQKAGASHLLVIAVAPVGARDHIVAVQLFEATRETALFEESVVQPGSAAAGTQQVSVLAAHLVAKEGPPKAAPVTTVVDDGPGTATWVGVGLMGAGVVAGAATLAAALSLSNAHDPLGAGTASAVGISASCGLVAAGTVAVAADWLHLL